MIQTIVPTQYAYNVYLSLIFMCNNVMSQMSP